MRTWVFDPHKGGVRIPEALKQSVIERLEKHAARKYKGLYHHLGIRFRGPLCYIDAFCEPEEPTAALLKANRETRQEYYARLRKRPIHLGRLRYCGLDRWSYAFYTYSNERYEPTIFPKSGWLGQPEAAFDIGAAYLGNR